MMHVWRWLPVVATVASHGCVEADRRAEGACEPFALGLAADTISYQGGSLRIVADLDCNGDVDTVTVGYAVRGQQQVPVVAVGGQTLPGAAALSVDEPPQHAVLGDLDGDGIRDAVLTLVDESSVFSTVVLMTRSGPALAKKDPAVDWRRMQYLIDEMTPLECIQLALPTVERFNASAAIAWPTGASAPATQASCGQLRRTLAEMKGGVLTLVSMPGSV